MEAERKRVLKNNSRLAEANNQLALLLYRKFCKDGGNVFFSPFSISIAMSMLMRGAKKNSLKELSTLLGFRKASLSPEDIHKSFGDFFASLENKQKVYTLAIANATAVQKQFPILLEYKSDLENFYRASTMELDFAQESANAVNQINEWVQEKTCGMIPKLFDSLEPSTVMILLNAIYFKGSWVEKFDKDLTKPGCFYNKGSQDLGKNVSMMFIREDFQFVESSTFKALQLPYEGNEISMFLFLPNEINGIEEMEKQLKVDFVKSLRPKMRRTEVDVTLPKFRVEYSKELKAVFQKLGLRSIFDDKSANLKGMCESGQLKVSEIIHKALLDVNEEGSEAAASSAVKIVPYCLSVPTPFLVDHPFIFVIYNKLSDLILFMGRINELPEDRLE